VAVVQEWAAQCHGFDTGLTAQLSYSARDGFTGRVGGKASGYDYHTVSKGRRGGDSPFDPSARGMPEHLMLWSEEWARHHRPVAASNGAENRPRGVNPSSEAENHSRGIAAGRLVVRYGFFGPWAFMLWAATTGRVLFRISSTFICVYQFPKMGFPRLLGDPCGCPQQ
jgi:hypothetical protein